MATHTETLEELRVPGLTAAATRIMEVASELFYSKGIHAVGVDTIARESGITKRTLYDRFGSKDNLVAVYLQARHHAWWERLERRIADAPVPRLLSVFEAYADDELTSDRGCAFLNAAGELPVDHPGYRVVRAHKWAVRERILELVRTDFPDNETPETVAVHLFLLLEGAIANRGPEGDSGLLAAARELAEGLVAQDSHTPSG